MFKSQTIGDSKDFYEDFFKKIDTLTSYQLLDLYKANIDVLNKALDYFKEKDSSFKLLENSIKNSFTKEKTIILNGKENDNKTNQLLVNSLEDKDYPIRLIFAVDMLNEGWDVLNLYDIVRLYDTRQGSGVAGKIGNYTIKEAQLIGRGARYYPFQITADQEKFKRKYDLDLENDLRILETMYFHSKNDSKYISELRQALIASGLQDEKPIERKYILKNSFKKSNFYLNTRIYSNKKIPIDRNDVKSIEDKVKWKSYQYSVKTNKGSIFSLIEEEKTHQSNVNIKSFKFKEIDYNILLGASERFNELKFDVVKAKYPNIKSMREFLTSDDYLGNSSIEIYYDDIITGRDLRNACIKALAFISNYVVSIKQEFEGTKLFEPKELKKF